MKTYPSISKKIIDISIYAFDKIDGSNIRVEWSRKTGFSKFGTRTRLLSPDEEPFGEAFEIFEKDFSKELSQICKKLQAERITFFLEFAGKNSFAGHHESEEHALTLFDVDIYNKGFLLPKEFLKLFEGIVPTAELLYIGKVNSDFITHVKEQKLDGMTFEGVVCKSQTLIKNQQARFKLKSDAWLNKLREFCKDDEKLFENLA